MSIRRIAAGLLVVALAVAPAHAQPRVGAFLDWVARELRLEQSTLAAMRRIADDSQARIAKSEAALVDARLELRELLEADEVDEAAVMAQLDRLGALSLETWKERVRALIGMRALLTPDQRAQLKRLARRTALRVGMACRADLRTLCPDATDRRGSRRCLQENAARLSDGCRAAIAGLPALGAEPDGGAPDGWPDAP